MSDYVESTADNRAINNAVRHQYRALSDVEKVQMQMVKDKGLELIQKMDSFRSVWAGETADAPGIDTAIQKVQEAVFWAVWHITGDK